MAWSAALVRNTYGDTLITHGMGEPFRRSAKYYDAYYCKLLDYSKHVDCLERIFARQGLDGELVLLDLACGTGTHSLELARRGHKATGIDISPEMIEEARRKGRVVEHGKNAGFLVQDMRSLDVDGRFDAAICMFGGFGYLNTDQDLTGFFSGLRRHLKPRGLFLFEFWNIGGLKDSPYRTWRKVEIEDGVYYNLSESNYDHERGILEISMEHLVHRDGSVIDDFTEKHDMRIYSLQEIMRLLSADGFELLEALDEGDLESMAPSSKETFRIFAVARTKPGETTST